MSKPLSAVDRASMEAFITHERESTVIHFGLDLLQLALDSEAFWRAAVRAAIEFPDDCCAFCGTSAMNGHASDCVKLLAQGGG